MATLKEELNDGVEEIFTEFDSIAISFTFKRFVSEDPVAGGTLTTVYSDQSSKFIYDSFSYLERASGNIQGEDIKILVQAKDFGARPVPQDKAVISGKDFDIIAADLDPSESLYTMQLRA